MSEITARVLASCPPLTFGAIRQRSDLVEQCLDLFIQEVEKYNQETADQQQHVVIRDKKVCSVSGGRVPNRLQMYAQFVGAAQAIDHEEMDLTSALEFHMIFQHFSEKVTSASVATLNKVLRPRLLEFASRGNFVMPADEDSHEDTKKELIPSETMKKVDSIMANIKSMTRKKALRLVQLLNLDDLEKIRSAEKILPSLLTESESIYVKYADDFKRRIPRDEIAELETQLKSLVRLMAVPDSIEYKTYGACLLTEDQETPGLLVQRTIDNVEICGSYGRGMLFSNNVDVVVASSTALPLNSLYYLLLNARIIKCRIPTGSLNSLHTVCKIRSNSPHRLVRFYLTSTASFPFSVLYHTGDTTFVNVMRSEAKRKGYCLSATGISSLPTASSSSSSTSAYQTDATDPVAQPAAIPAITTERDIFDFLGIRYVEPTHRALIVQKDQALAQQPDVKVSGVQYSNALTAPSASCHGVSNDVFRRPQDRDGSQRSNSACSNDVV